jgi:uncharacterized protein (TIGR03435 family)
MNRKAIGIALAAVGFVRSQELTPRPGFEVASIKRNTRGDRGVRISAPPGRFNAENVWVRFLIQFAWGVKDFQISGGPGWSGADRYDVIATTGAATAEGKAGLEQRKLMLRSLLEDRFQLMVHRESKELPVYELVAAKGGIKLRPSKVGSCVAPGPNLPPLAPGQKPNFCGGLTMSPRSLDGTAITMEQVTTSLSQTLQRTVIDKTGFTSTFDVHIEWTADQSTPGLMAPGLAPVAPAASDDPTGRSIFTAIQEQLGLKLEPAKAPVEVLVIDRLERPSEN